MWIKVDRLQSDSGRKSVNGYYQSINYISP